MDADINAAAYQLPNDEREMGRLDLTHHMNVRNMGDKLYLAPIVKEKIHRILDIGTGTGICKFFFSFLSVWEGGCVNLWVLVTGAIEMGDEFPAAEVGVLLSVPTFWGMHSLNFEIR